MSKELAEKALRRIMEYEGGDLSDIWDRSRVANAEYGYIVTDGEVQKVIGTQGGIRGEKMEGISFKDAVFWHTHIIPNAALSVGDVAFVLTDYEMDGIGVIAEWDYKYWEISKTQAKELLREREKIYKKWEEAVKKGEEAKATGDRDTFERCVKICLSCRSKVGANTKKARELVLTEVLSGEVKAEIAVERTGLEPRAKPRKVLEDIPTFMGTDGEIYKLNKGDIVDLPKTNADVLCKRGVMELFVEIIPPEKPEKVEIHGILKTRYRCPVCYRAAPDNFCMVHSDVEAIDLLAADETVKEAVIDLTFLDLFKTKHPEKKRWTFDELHDAIGIDIDYAPEFLDKQRPPETYAEYYEHEFNVKIEGIKPPEVVKPPVEERTDTQEMVYGYFKKEIAETGVDAYQRGYLDALHREIGREFTVDHLLLVDSEELYTLMDLKREELEDELKRRLTPVPPSVEELAETEKLEILRKIRKYKEVKTEAPELKIGAMVKMNDKEGILVDVSANKYRVNWDDGTWDWIRKKDSETIVVY